MISKRRNSMPSWKEPHVCRKYIFKFSETERKSTAFWLIKWNRLLAKRDPLDLFIRFPPILTSGVHFQVFGESLPKAVCKSLPPFNPSSYKVSHESRSSEFIGISRKRSTLKHISELRQELTELQHIFDNETLNQADRENERGFNFISIFDLSCHCDEHCCASKQFAIALTSVSI